MVTGHEVGANSRPTSGRLPSMGSISAFGAKACERFRVAHTSSFQYYRVTWAPKEPLAQGDRRSLQGGNHSCDFLLCNTGTPEYGGNVGLNTLSTLLLRLQDENGAEISQVSNERSVHPRSKH